MQKVVQHLPQASSPKGAATCGYTVINFNTTPQTLRCIDSLTRCHEPPRWIFVLDNASTPEQFVALQAALPPAEHSEIRLYRSEENTGFAKGSNLLIAELLTIPQCQFVGLLNNDAVAMPNLVTELRHALTTPPGASMAGGRMHKLHNPDQVDTLGISIYKSLMPADRHDLKDIFVGPTGGCALFTRQFLEAMVTDFGYIFDERFFCYCEDTDLVLRGRLTGHGAVYVDALVALHEGQASSHTRNDDFIAYHGLRNAIWMHRKLFSRKYMVKHSPWLASAHVAMVLKYATTGRFRLLLNIWKDAFSALPHTRQTHSFHTTPPHWREDFIPRLISPSFYRSGYFLTLWQQRRSPHQRTSR